MSIDDKCKTRVKVNGNQKIIRNMKPKIDTSSGNYFLMSNVDMDLAWNILTPEEFKVWIRLIQNVPYYARNTVSNYSDYVLYRGKFTDEDFRGSLTDWTYKKAVNGLIEQNYLKHIDGQLYEVYSRPYKMSDEIKQIIKDMRRKVKEGK